MLSYSSQLLVKNTFSSTSSLQKEARVCFVGFFFPELLIRMLLGAVSWYNSADRCVLPLYSSHVFCLCQAINSKAQRTKVAMSLEAYSEKGPKMEQLSRPNTKRLEALWV